MGAVTRLEEPLTSKRTAFVTANPMPRVAGVSRERRDSMFLVWETKHNVSDKVSWLRSVRDGKRTVTAPVKVGRRIPLSTMLLVALLAAQNRR